VTVESVGIVVIGRNEGERLARCLRSLPPGARAVYVDSDSTDGSVDRAREAGLPVVALDPKLPLSAARARNAGFAYLTSGEDAPEWIQFVDGDCELETAWLEGGVEALQSRAGSVLVFGRLTERDANANVYSRLSAQEWSKPLGAGVSCGGVFLVEASAFRAVDGFREEIRAGEEGDLCLRLRRNGGETWSLEDPMATHDMGTVHFSQWWRRMVRAGSAYAHSLSREGFAPDVSHRRLASALFWSWGWLGLVGVGALAGPLGAGVAFALLPLQVARVAWRRHRGGSRPGDALEYAAWIALAKFAEGWGAVRFLLSGPGRGASGRSG